jgi:hypothetical protein
MNERFDWKDWNEHIRIKLNKKELKLIFDMHGEIGLEEHLHDIIQRIKNEIMEIECQH